MNVIVDSEDAVECSEGTIEYELVQEVLDLMQAYADELGFEGPIRMGED